MAEEVWNKVFAAEEVWNKVVAWEEVWNKLPPCMVMNPNFDLLSMWKQYC